MKNKYIEKARKRRKMKNYKESLSLHALKHPVKPVTGTVCPGAWTHRRASGTEQKAQEQTQLYTELKHMIKVASRITRAKMDFFILLVSGAETTG